MTSSLVGSEMCIRDSPRRRLARGRVVARRWVLWCRRRRRMPGVLVGVLTVSYTHLTLPTICSV
eukprot:10231937-Prorocentrum_lima.AAC.1